MTSKINNLNKMSMHRRPTYEKLVKDTILEPKDKIALPDRTATILRKTQKLSQFDDPSFIDLEETQQKIRLNQIQAQNVQQAISKASPSASAGIVQAMTPTSPPLRRAAVVPIPPQVPIKHPQPLLPIAKASVTPQQSLEPQQSSVPAELIADTTIEAEMEAVSREYTEQLERAQELEEARKIKAAASSTESLSKPTTVVQTIIQSFQQHMAVPKSIVLPQPKPHPYPATYTPAEEVQRIYRHPAKATSSRTAPIEAAASAAAAAVYPESSTAAAAISPESSAAASSSPPTTRKKKTFTPGSEIFKMPYPSSVSTEYALDLLTYAAKNNYLPGDETPNNILRLVSEYKSSKRKNPALTKQIKEKYKEHYEQLRKKLNK